MNDIMNDRIDDKMNNRIDNTINTLISYRDLNYDIIQNLAIIMIGNKDIEKSLYSIEDCELFKGFCILNKGLCFLNKEFRKEYNISMRIIKCNLIYETNNHVDDFINSPTNNWLPFNKTYFNKYNQNIHTYHRYLRNIHYYGNGFQWDIKPIIKTIEDNEDKFHIVQSTHFLSMVKLLKRNSIMFREFITELRLNLTDNFIEIRKQSMFQRYDTLRIVKNVEKEIIFFIKLLLE